MVPPGLTWVWIMHPAAPPMTVDEYYAITVEGDRCQLVNGAIVVNDDPKPVHAELQARLLIALRAWTAAGPGRGMAWLPTNVEIDAHNVYGPDLMWFAEDNRPPTLTEYPDRVPNLCVEIRSPSTWRYDRGAKRAGYERAGVGELWLVDDEAKRVLVHRRSRPESPAFDVALELAVGDELISPQLPGFAVALDALFDL